MDTLLRAGLFTNGFFWRKIYHVDMIRIGKNKLIFSLVTILVITSGFFLWDKIFTAVVKNIPSTIPPSPVDWKTFTNTRFGYSIEYSSLVQIMSGTDGADPQTDSAADFFIPGESQFTVGVQSTSVNHISSNLKTYIETIYQDQVSDSNPSIKNKQVGPLEESIIDGQKAYQFTLTGSFAFDATGRTGYTIGDKPSMYVITESPSGDKFIIHYLVGDPVSEKMFRSFKFVR